MNIENIRLASQHFAGFLVVVFALATLWALTALMSWLVRRFESSGVPVPPSTVTLATSSALGEPAPDDEAAVVIAAVVTMLLGPNSRVVAVHPTKTSWADSGRRDIHLSHRLR